MEVRHLNQNEWEKYRDIRLEFLKNEPQASSYFYEEEINKSDQEWQDEIKELFEDQEAIFWIAEDDEGNVKGIVGGIRDTGSKQRHIAIVISMYLNADCRGKGIGKKLLGSLLEELEKNPAFIKINLDVTTSQEAAFNLYKSFGFEQTGLWKKEYFVNGEYFDVYEMEKYLK